MKEVVEEKKKVKKEISKKTLLKAYELMSQALSMTELYEEKKSVTSKYVHATSRGHEAIQLAVSMQLKPCDYVTPYYRDDSMLLGIGMRPFDLMLQLLGKKNDPFSGGRTYYSHPSLKDDDKPKIPHQSSATGMQAIPATGLAMGIQYLENQKINTSGDAPLVICSLGDACITEGEVSEAFHMAALKQLPIIFLVQDNEWDISAHASEIRTGNAYDFAQGFPGLEAMTIDGTDFMNSYSVLEQTIEKVRNERRPFLIHAEVPLLNHHTSGVRMEWYRDDLKEQQKRDPYPKFKAQLREAGIGLGELINIEVAAKKTVEADFQLALKEEDPQPEDLFTHDFAPTPITEEKGEREPAGKEPTVMVDSALFAVQELMTKHPECLLYGQDVGGRLGGVFREAATLAQKFGEDRVFNTPIQEAFIIGSTVGMSAAGTKPIVEVQFADYIWPGLNQLFTEVSRSCYLSNGKWPVSSIIRVPIGAYGSGGPYHSSSVESVLSNIRGIKIAYPSTGADLKGLMKSAYYDPNPCIMLEHKGLYWSKIKGTEGAKTIEPDEDYVIPFGKGRVVIEADLTEIEKGESLAIITYGMGVYWATEAAKKHKGKVEVIDVRTIYPLDEKLITETASKHGKCMVVTEEPRGNGFGHSIASLISRECFEKLDAPVSIVGSENMPAIPLNSTLEATMIPNANKVENEIKKLLSY
jgi:2-oxoisovalerate dehydrogenase E1 component